MEYFSTAITENDFPSDGLVALYDDIAYGDSLGRTAKFPEMLLHLNGQMRSEKPIFWRSNGARQEQG